MIPRCQTDVSRSTRPKYIKLVCGGFPKLGVPFLGVPNNKDNSRLGSILGSPYFGKLPCVHCIKRIGEARMPKGLVQRVAEKEGPVAGVQLHI